MADRVPRRPADDATGARVLAAARGLFAERGFHGTPVPMVAERAQVGAGTIYRYFQSKEALVNALYRIEKVPTLRGRVGEIWAVDGAAIKINALWDGSETEPLYFWYPDGFERASFKNDDFVYIMSNGSTYRVVGLSPIETLKLTIDAELSGSAYNTRQVQNAAPDGMLDLGEGARPDQVEEFKSYWLSEVAGKGAMAFIGGSKNAKFIPFRSSNRDMQFLEWQIYLVRKIAAVFGLTPQDLGVTFDVNRSTSEVQQENAEDRGLRPLLALVQEYLTREIAWDPAFGGADNNLARRNERGREPAIKLWPSHPVPPVKPFRRPDGNPFATGRRDAGCADDPRNEKPVM